MSPRSPSRPTDRLVLTLTALVVVAAVGLAVWSAAFNAANDRPTVEHNISGRYADIDRLDATRTTVIERNGTATSRRVYDATLAPSTGERRLRLVGNGSTRYDLRVSNGSVLWLHDTDAATVTRIPIDGPPAADTGERIQRLLVRANLTASGRSPERPPTVEPLPVVPASPAGADAVAPATNYEVSYTGTETIDGRSAYALTLTPRSNVSTYRQTLWIDTEWFYPLQRQTVWTDGGVRTELTTTHTDVTVNPPPSNGTFRPEIPANTTVETVETPDTETYWRLDDLRSDTAIAVPDPDLPPSYELTYATHTEGRIRGVGLRYTNRTSSITVSKYNFTYAAADEPAVTVDGRPATLSVGPTSSVSWNCETYRYTVRGTGVTTDQLVAVAQSVGCPG